MKLLLTTTILLTSLFTIAQNITIPDANFKNALLNHSPKIDTNNDGKIQVSEAKAFTGDLDFFGANASNLSGIEHFVNIQKLRADYNSFRTIDLAPFTKLKEASVGSNINLETVKATSVPMLEKLNIQASRNLTTVNLPSTSNTLKELDFTSGNLTTIDISGLNNLKSLKCSFNNNLTSIILPTSTSNKLEHLGFQETKISSIDLSTLVNLEYLFCRKTQLTTLNLSKNGVLQQVFGANNSKITSINVKNGRNSILTDLELNNCPNLTTICVDDVTEANNKFQNLTNWTKDVTATVKSCIATFTDATNTKRWHEKNNWNTNEIPTPFTDVIIPSGKNIEINSNSNAQNVTVNGTLSILPTTSLTINNLTVSNTGAVSVQSNANNTASLLVNGVATGNVTFNRYIKDTKWHLIVAPVRGQSIDDFAMASNLATGTNTNRGLATYNTESGKWNYYKSGSTGSGNFSNYGYAIKTTTVGSKIFKGTIFSKANSVDANTTLYDRKATGGNKWNLIGNPYISYMAVNNVANATHNFLAKNTSQLDPNRVAVYLWNPSTNSYEPINQSVTIPKFIAPGQAFFVESKNNGGTIKYTMDTQSHQTTNLFYRPTNNKQSKTNNPFSVDITISNGENTKKTAIVYLDNATEGLDIGYDAGVFSAEKNNFGVFTQFVDTSNKIPLAIQTLPNKNYENHSVPIGINTLKNSEITFSINAINIPNTYQVYLEDKKEKKIIPFNKPYTTTVEKTEAKTGRFFLHTSAKALSTETSKINTASFFVVDNIVHIKGVKGKADIQVFNVLGKQVFNSQFKSQDYYQAKLPKMSSGIYIVKLNTQTIEITKKIIIK